MDAFFRPTWAEISLDALRHNLLSFRRMLPPSMRIMAVVKANAYGHGAVAVAREAADAGASYLGVAFLDEALELRRAGILTPILVLGYTPPEGVEEALKHRITITLFSEEVLERAARVATPAQPLTVHIKIDTGMGRIGLPTKDEAISFIEKALATPGVNVEGLFTHFASADEADKSSACHQYERFREIVDHFQQKGIQFPYLHTGNSAAAIDLPHMSYNMVRLGISLYGYYPSVHVDRKKLDLQPVMTFKTRTVMVKTLPPGSGVSYGSVYRTKGREQIATLPVGYADGYTRMLSGRAHVLIRGQRVPVVGTICMDQCMINVTGLPDVKVGEEVVLFGRQGNQTISAEEVAEILGTIPYEITCMLSSRVPKIYFRDGKRVEVFNHIVH